MNGQVLETTLAAIKLDRSDDTGQLFVAMIAAYLQEASDENNAVTTSLRPEDIQSRFVESLPMGPLPIAHVMDRIRRDVLPDVIKLTHPRYMGVNVAPPLPAALWTEALIAALNQSVRAFVMSPTITPIENQVVRWLADCVGYSASAGGTLTSGGTEANFTALLAARAAITPAVWEEGLGESMAVVFCGENAHVSVIRAVAQLGLGTRRAVRVALQDHRMDTKALASHVRDAARSGTTIMAVVATAGAPATGAFDDVDAIGRICEDHGIWFHVDGAHGATALLSESHRFRLRGIERAHSVTWDAHKMMMMPLSAGVLLVRDAATLARAFAPDGVEPKQVDRWNLGACSFMTSRRADALKLWVGLLRYGAGGIGAIYDYLCELTVTLYRHLAARGDFMPLHVPDCNLLCFRYIGELRLGAEAIDLVNRKLYDQLIRSGQAFIATVTLDGQFWLRVTIMNPLTQEQHLRDLVEELAAIGRQVVDELSGITGRG
jgi:L-2,4-diaminobutyrate decarboxylase